MLSRPPCVPLDQRLAEELYQSHQAGLRRLIRGVVGSCGPVEDLLQMVFVRLLETPAPREVAAHKSWLYRVAINEALQLKRRGAIADRAHAERAEQADSQGEPGPAAIAAQKELAEEAWRAVAQLPHQQRTVLRMRIEEDKSYAAISEELGIPLGTALTRMRRALQKLRRRISK